MTQIKMLLEEQGCKFAEEADEAAVAEAFSDVIKLKDSKIEMLESELASYQEKEKAQILEMEKAKEKENAALVEKLCDKAITDKKLFKAHVETFFRESIRPKVAAGKYSEVEKAIDAMPVVGSEKEGSEGDGKKTSSEDKYTELHERATKYSETHKVTYREAVDAVLDEQKKEKGE